MTGEAVRRSSHCATSPSQRRGIAYQAIFIVFSSKLMNYKHTRIVTVWLKGRKCLNNILNCGTDSPCIQPCEYLSCVRMVWKCFFYNKSTFLSIIQFNIAEQNGRPEKKPNDIVDICPPPPPVFIKLRTYVFPSAADETNAEESGWRSFPCHNSDL